MSPVVTSRTCESSMVDSSNYVDVFQDLSDNDFEILKEIKYDILLYLPSLKGVGISCLQRIGRYLHTPTISRNK
jgi:hypothetical protein